MTMLQAFSELIGGVVIFNFFEKKCIGLPMLPTMSSAWIATAWDEDIELGMVCDFILRSQIRLPKFNT